MTHLIFLQFFLNFQCLGFGYLYFQLFIKDEDELKRSGKTMCVDSSRFRPNLVVSAVGEPYAEDGWQSLKIGKTCFTVIYWKPMFWIFIYNLSFSLHFLFIVIGWMQSMSNYQPGSLECTCREVEWTTSHVGIFPTSKGQPSFLFVWGFQQSGFLMLRFWLYMGFLLGENFVWHFVKIWKADYKGFESGKRRRNMGWSWTKNKCFEL